MPSTTEVMAALYFEVAAFLATELDNLVHWMGWDLTPFNLDESTLFPIIMIMMIGMAGLIAWCAPGAHDACKSIPSDRSPFPPTVPATSNSVGGGLGAVRWSGWRIVTTYNGSRLYGCYRKVVDWFSPERPETLILRMFLLSVLGPILFTSLAAPFMYLKGLVAGLNSIQHFRSLECRRLENIYHTLGRHQTGADRRASYHCMGERHGFDLQDTWEDVQDHPCLNGDIFHLAALTVAAVLLGAFLLGVYIQQEAQPPFGGEAPTKVSGSHGLADEEDGTVECNGPVTVAQDEPGRVQEAEEQIPDKETALQKPTPQPKVVSPAESQLKATGENRTGGRKVKKGDPRRQDAAAPKARSVKRENDRLLQKLKETEEQLARESTMRSLVEGRLAVFQKLSGVVADKKLSSLIAKFNELEDKCEAMAGSNTREQMVDLQKICSSSFPRLLEKARDMTFSINIMRNEERIEQAVAKDDLKRKLERSFEANQSLLAQLENRPVPQPLPDPATPARAELDAMRQHQLAEDAFKAQLSEQVIAATSRIEELVADNQEAKAFAESVAAVKDNEIAAQRKELDDKKQETEGYVQRIRYLERELIDKEQQLTNSREQTDAIAEALAKGSKDASSALAAKAESEFRVKGAEATVVSLQKALGTAVNERAHLAGLLEAARSEKDAESQRHLQAMQAGQQQLITLERESEAMEAGYQQRINNLMSEGEALLEENKELRKEPQAGTSPELSDAHVKIIELEGEIETLKDQLRREETKYQDRVKHVVADWIDTIKTAKKGEKDATNKLIEATKKVKSLEEQLRQKTIALSNANSRGGPLVNPGS